MLTTASQQSVYLLICQHGYCGLDISISINHCIWATTRQNVSSGVSDLARHKPDCAANEASQNLEISAIESRDIILSKQRTTKALIRLVVRIWHKTRFLMARLHCIWNQMLVRYLNQGYGENGHINYFMTKSLWKLCGRTKDRTCDLNTSRREHPTDLWGLAI